MPTDAKKTETQKATHKGAKASLDPDLHYQIEKKAYEIWLSSGRSHGGDVEHWLQAEIEVLAQRRRRWLASSLRALISSAMRG
jgi:hypothetical protein